MPVRATRHSRRALFVIVIVIGAAAVTTGGCASGPRPTPSSPVGEAAEDADIGGGEPVVVGKRRPARPVPRWSVRLMPGVDVDVGVVATRLCFDGPAPPRVGPEHGPALTHLVGEARAVSADGSDVGALPLLDDGIDTGSLLPGQ